MERISHDCKSDGQSLETVIQAVIQTVRELSQEIMPLIHEKDRNAIHHMRSLFDSALTAFPVADDVIALAR
ncbi:MAG: hypothetical protein ACFE0J_00085 [Elainellaceae cyanobacterium]